LPRPGICPYEHKPGHVCGLCRSLRELDIESFIKKDEDEITKFANLGGDDAEEVLVTADSDSLLEVSEGEWY
jgi:hypothetical protein